MSSTNKENDVNNDNYSAENITPADDSIVLENMEYPVLSLRDIVVFPGNTASLFVGRKASLEAASAAYNYNTPLILLTQIDAKTEHPEAKD